MSRDPRFCPRLRYRPFLNRPRSPRRWTNLVRAFWSGASEPAPKSLGPPRPPLSTTDNDDPVVSAMHIPDAACAVEPLDISTTAGRFGDGVTVPPPGHPRQQTKPRRPCSPRPVPVLRSECDWSRPGNSGAWLRRSTIDPPPREMPAPGPSSRAVLATPYPVFVFRGRRCPRAPIPIEQETASRPPA